MAAFITPVRITPGTAGSWQDVDVSAHIPAGSTGVILHVFKNYSAISYDFGLRKKGSTDDRHNTLYSDGHLWAAVGVDGNRVFQCYTGHITRVDAYLVGYFGSEAVFFDNAVDKSLAGTGSWDDIDISANTGADTAIGAIFDVVGVWQKNLGLRNNGSSDNRLSAVSEHIWAVIGVDGAEICEGQIADAGIKFWLVGYLKSGATFNTNATDIALGGVGSWTDLAALPAGGIGGIIEVFTSSYTYDYGLREKGSAEDIYGRAPYARAWAMVEADNNRLIEGKISNTGMDFYLVGYFTPTSTAPTITLLNPNSGAVGTSVTITGTDFGAVQGNGTVRFNGVLATITSWADTSIVCVVPDLATTGPVVVTNNSGLSSAGTTMTVTDVPPYLTDGLTTGDDEDADFYACVYLGQFFVPTETLSSLAVQIKGKKSGSPGTTTFEIHAANAQHKPTGPVLATGTTDADTWTTDASGQWVVVPVTEGVVLQAGTEYTLTWYAAAGDATNKGQARRSSTGGYADGGTLTSADCGVTWTVTTTNDFVFEVIGLPVAPASGAPPAAGRGLTVLSAGASLGYSPVQG